MAVIGSGVIEFKLSYTLDNAIRAVLTGLEKRGITVHRVFFGTHNGQGVAALRHPPSEAGGQMTKADESQDCGKGSGHGLSSFLQRFNEICTDHLANGRAKSFAFIFYDFTDQAIRQILKNEGVFANLDRISGKELSVFYLHAGTKAAVKAFNAHFFGALGVKGQATLPCVVFFRVERGVVEDIEIAQLGNANLIHGFHELHNAIQQYLSASPAVRTSPSRAIRWLKGGAKFLSGEGLRADLKRSLELISF